MRARFNRMLDAMSEYLAGRRGLLPLLGVLLVLLNILVTLVSPQGWWAQSDLLLQIGVVIAILGILLAWAL